MACSTSSSPTASRARRGPLVLGLVIGLVVGLVIGLVAFLLADPARDATDEPAAESSAVARSVIFINGDGMGATHREAARLDQHGRDGALAMDAMPVLGLQSTSSADPYETVTDSAAAASAWATGERTYNGAISVDLDGNALPTLGAEAKEAGRATGLVTTAQVTDASPAAFFSSTTERDRQGDIARQYLERTQPDVILGGGANRWQGLADLAEGYQFVRDADELAAADGDRLLGLFADEEMFTASPEGDGDEYAPTVPLAVMTAKALDVLARDEDGFFLFVEEEAVDEMSHANNGGLMLQAMRSLDDAVRVARAFVAEHPDTLLIVAGDHESGGLTVEDVAEELGDSEDGPFPVAGGDQEFVLDWTSGAHTSAPTPVSAEGPGSEQLDGYYPNTHLHGVMREALTG